MKAKDFEDKLEDEGFDVTEDKTDVLGFGSKTFTRNDGEETVQVIVSVESSKN